MRTWDTCVERCCGCLETSAVNQKRLPEILEGKFRGLSFKTQTTTRVCRREEREALTPEVNDRAGQLGFMLYIYHLSRIYKKRNFPVGVRSSWHQSIPGVWERWPTCGWRAVFGSPPAPRGQHPDLRTGLLPLCRYKGPNIWRFGRELLWPSSSSSPQSVGHCFFPIILSVSVRAGQTAVNVFHHVKTLDRNTSMDVCLCCCFQKENYIKNEILLIGT